MRAVHISCVVLLVATARSDPQEGTTIHITGPAEVIFGNHVPAVEQCTGKDGFCVETGDRCAGTIKFLHSSCNDHCTCCIPEKQGQLDSVSYKHHVLRKLNQSPVGTIPDIHIMQPGPPRIVIVVEDTTVMLLQRRWEFVRKALHRTALFDVPDGAHVAVVVFDSIARTAAPLSKVDALESSVRQRIGTSLPRNPSRIPERDKCILCGFQEALRALDSDENGADGSTVVLLTAGATDIADQELNEISLLAKERNIQVEAVVYPFTEKSGSITNKHGLEDIVRNTHGSAYTVMDEGIGNDSKLSVMVALMDSLRAVIQHSSSSGTPTLVHNKMYPGDITSQSMAKGSFTLDESLGPDMYFFIYYYDLNHVGNAIELTMPSGKTVSNADMQEDTNANVVYINIPSAERGEWRYQVENRADSHQGLIMQVTTSENKVECPEAEEFFKLPGSPQCFKAFTDKYYSGNDAEAMCRSNGLVLAKPHDDVAVELSRYLNRRYGGDYDNWYWLDARGDGSSIRWQRGGGEVLDTSNSLWYDFHPDSERISPQHCLYMATSHYVLREYTGHVYGTYDCSAMHTYSYPLCERIM